MNFYKYSYKARSFDPRTGTTIRIVCTQRAKIPKIKIEWELRDPAKRKFVLLQITLLVPVDDGRFSIVVPLPLVCYCTKDRLDELSYNLFEFLSIFPLMIRAGLTDRKRVTEMVINKTIEWFKKQQKGGKTKMKEERTITVSYPVHIPIDILEQYSEEDVKKIIKKLKKGKKVSQEDISKVKETVYELVEEVLVTSTVEPEIVESDLPGLL